MREEILADGIRLICGDCREVLPTDFFIEKPKPAKQEAMEL